MNYILLLSLLFFSACASKARPQLYPNEIYNQRGAQKAQADIDECLKKAEDYFSTAEGKKIAKSAGTGSTIGGSVGIGFGAGDSGVGLGVGVGTGRTITSTDVKRNFTNQCLLDKGYQVLAWD